jgi:predicted nucleotidyltransferase
MYQGVPQSALRKRLLGLLKVPDDVIDAARSSAQDAPAGVTAILFGSVAQGAQNQYSDMDICIIAPSGTHVEDWVNQYVAGLHNITPLPVNLLRYTPEEWSAAIDIDELVVQDIIHTGLRLTPASS